MSEAKRNYQYELDMLLNENIKKGIIPKLYLHACCAPCSSYVLEYLSRYFNITVVFYNPNITDNGEYEYRLSEEERFINEMKFINHVSLIKGDYNPEVFFDMSKGLETAPERGPRCLKCYGERLRYTAELAKAAGADYFATTLTLSPLKNAAAINSIGDRLSKELAVSYLSTDFKKKGGYLRSIELSKEYNLYRQNYCGCVYSKRT